MVEYYGDERESLEEQTGSQEKSLRARESDQFVSTLSTKVTVIR